MPQNASDQIAPPSLAVRPNPSLLAAAQTCEQMDGSREFLVVAQNAPMALATPCPFCPATRFICFWGEINVYAPWRRLVLLGASILMAALFGGIMWFFASELNWLWWFLCIPMFLVSLLSIGASLVGCERCVVRLYGDA